MRLALFQPDIPQNLGAAIRLGACLGVAVDVIRPAAFPLDSQALKRAAMDYRGLAEVTVHDGWAGFCDSLGAERLVLLTTKAASELYDFAFAPGDVVLVGRESAGAPAAVHERADARLCIPMAAGARSLNVVVAAGIALAEAARQLRR